MKNKNLVYGLLLLTTLFLGCLGEAPGEAMVSPLEDILVSGPEFSFPTPKTATILLDTDIEVVCAAVYGTTTDYGMLATDTDMAGGGHRNHHPLMKGLMPDTLYHVRLQGVGPDGTLYRSRDYTFRTPPGEEDSSGEPKGDNLALMSKGASIVDVSSNYGGTDNKGSFGAEKAFDGNPTTEWSSDGDGSNAYIEIELPKKFTITEIGFWTRTMGSTAQIFSFTVRTEDGDTYGPFALKGANAVEYFETDFSARRLRFEMDETSGGNTGAVEIEVYGTEIT